MALAECINRIENFEQLVHEDAARYPYRLPDWFWQSPQNADLLPPNQVISTRNDIAKLDELSRSSAKQKLEIDIAERLASKFSLHDLALRSTVVSSPKNGVSLAILIDPSFASNAKAMLQEAALRFLEVAFDPAVIRKAFNRSTETPNSAPADQSAQNCAPGMDESGLPECSDYLLQKARR
jgi:hypothetical protein